VITWLEIADVFQAGVPPSVLWPFRRQRVARPSVSPMKRADVIRLAVGSKFTTGMFEFLSGFLLAVVPCRSVAHGRGRLSTRKGPGGSARSRSGFSSSAASRVS
jgi:hypothetical protein